MSCYLDICVVIWTMIDGQLDYAGKWYVHALDCQFSNE